MRPAYRLLALAAAGSALAGCDSPQNYVFNTGGTAAATLAHLGWYGLLAFMSATFVTLCLIAWLAFRRRGTLAEHESIYSGDQGQSWILIGGFAIPFAVLTFLLVATMDTLNAFPIMDGHEQLPDIVVTGHQWWFQLNYQFAGHPDENVESATEIHLPVGRPMTLALKSADVIHSFWVPKLHGKVDMIPGQTNYIRIEADRPGVFQGECAEFCGEQHAHMRLQVVAQTPEQYEQWLAHMRADANEPTDPLARRGEDVFLSQACALCHTIRGTIAMGVTGPDLTHIGSRRTIAGGEFKNTPGNLGAWVTSAQNLKPGVLMPNIETLNGPDLRALVAYLESLK